MFPWKQTFSISSQLPSNGFSKGFKYKNIVANDLPYLKFRRFFWTFMPWYTICQFFVFTIASCNRYIGSGAAPPTTECAGASCGDSDKRRGRGRIMYPMCIIGLGTFSLQSKIICFFRSSMDKNFCLVFRDCTSNSDFFIIFTK